jgi:hypothetical protein
MSFGFSVGGFVACLLLIKDVTESLNSSTGSVSDFSNLLRSLKSLEQALVASQIVYDQWQALEATSQFKRSAGYDEWNTIRAQAMQSDTRWLPKLLKPYTDAFIKGRGMSLVRQMRSSRGFFAKTTLRN